jgi:FAD-dependent urate hydroxylase
MDKLKVIVVGAGMGGLTAAIAMQQAGFEVEIYDRVAALTPAGAGVSLWSNGVKVLNRLGLGSRIQAVGGDMQRMMYISHVGEVLTDFSLAPLINRVGQQPYPVTRTDLQRLLLDALASTPVHLNFNCVGVEQDEHGATAVFENGHRTSGDLVIAADGTHSLLRTFVLGERPERRYVGYVNWNGLVASSDDLAPSNAWVVYVGNHQRASMMPVGDNRFYFFFDVPLPKGTPNDRTTYRNDLLRHFAAWPEPVQRLIARLDVDRTNRVEIHDVQPLHKLVNGRIALLGDAAHSTAPDLGQGGCQAMEDAWVLANCLLTTNISVPDALERYQNQRLARTSDIVLKARKRSNMTHGKDPAATQAWYEQLRSEDGSNIMGAIADTILGGPLH